MYSRHTVGVTVTYADTLTEGGGERKTVRVQYAYSHSYQGSPQEFCKA